ncbi:hypothetical protein F4808DRAFT_141761 [Astrocystis sublimbata]|nr:hypothetical protein F4808DRAFT_141761 [Astrocystis sublimbata]
MMYRASSSAWLASSPGMGLRRLGSSQQVEDMCHRLYGPPSVACTPKFQTSILGTLGMLERKRSGTWVVRVEQGMRDAPKPLTSGSWVAMSTHLLSVDQFQCLPPPSRASCCQRWHNNLKADPTGVCPPGNPFRTFNSQCVLFCERKKVRSYKENYGRLYEFVLILSYEFLVSNDLVQRHISSLLRQPQTRSCHVEGCTKHGKDTRAKFEVTFMCIRSVIYKSYVWSDVVITTYNIAA